MNTDIIQTAKDLITKGKILNDPELIKMGTDLLDNVIPEKTEHAIVVPPVKQYICGACDSTFSVDRPNRRKCLHCGKHKLTVVIEESKEEIADQTKDNTIPVTPIAPANDFEQFNVQVRNVGGRRIRYNEDGEEEGVYTRTEEVMPMKNTWNDDGDEYKDKANEQLKSLTKVSVRTRRSPKKVKRICRQCKKDYSILPIHAGGKQSTYICDKCVSKRGRN